MTLAPLLTAPLIVQIHVAFALIALAVGPFPLFLALPRRWHRGQAAGRTHLGSWMQAAWR